MLASPALTAFIAPSGPALRFAGKTLLAGGIALWLSFRLDLEQPQWALMTVFIVSQPLSGMVVAKGLFRLLGTLVGTSMAVLIMALFAQTPWLFLLVVALWMGLCTAASTLLRNHVSYAFVLSGYTVAIIALPAINVPLQVFDQAVARCTEICLGIVCASVVSATLWPQRVEENLARVARETLDAALQAAANALRGQAREPEGILQLLGRIVAADAQRDHAWFEGHQGQRRALALRTLSRDVLSLLRTARGASRQRQVLSPEAQAQLQPWLDELLALLPRHTPEQLQALRDRLLQASADEALDNDLRYCLARCAVLLIKVEAAETAAAGVASGEFSGDASSGLSWHRDWLMALFYGLRSALALLGIAAFWLASAWPAAVGGMLMAGILCSLFANRDNAVELSMSFLRGILYALLAAIVVDQWLLPQWNGFPLLCMALGVPLFFAALGMAGPPALIGTATTFAIQFITFIAPRNDMHYDFASLLNSAQATVIGVGFAAMVFRLLALPPDWVIRRLGQAMALDLGRLTRYPLDQAESWFGGRMADRLIRLARHYALLPQAMQRRWLDGLLALDMGSELLHLRHCLAGARGVLRKRRQAFLDNLGDLFQAGPAPGREARLDELCDELDAALRSDPGHLDENNRLARAALRQLSNTWRAWCRLEDEHGPG
ncbi:FUSC family protein [Pseudomonas citronellolis]|uniref:FUSC family protein n=1 Tax=Pseudomonas citronellolis TaxID=53408 RepID=UPI00078E3D8A|nr:FUSC family protein [Pseudomonas citronellolis]AMO76503.1 p-hydroxybenzoic acid efflux pump subunit AaeB [Pseudomonas citronellolis]